MKMAIRTLRNALLLVLLFSMCYVADAQNVGIGTSTPISKLEVHDGTLTITNTLTSATLAINRANTIAGTSTQISFQDNGTTKWALGGTNIGSAGANNISFYNYNMASNAFTISYSNNNIGVGTTSPGTRLQVVGGYDGDGISIVGSTFGPKDIALQLTDDGGHNAFLGLASFPNAWMSGINAGDIVLGTSNGNVWIGNGAPTAFPSLLVAQNGRVSIGTINPITYPFYVTGSGGTTGQFSNSSSTTQSYGVEGDCNTTPGTGTGVAGFAGQTGILGWTLLNGTGDRYAVRGEAGGGDGINYGIYGEASGTNTAYGVFGHAYGATNTYAGYFEGNVLTTGVYQTSDRKFKNNIKPLNGALSIINQLKPSVYTFKTNEFKRMSFDEGLQYGLIADEVQQVLPGAVKKAVQPAEYETLDKKKGKKLSDEIEFNAVNYTQMIPILIGAVKEQQAVITNQQKKIDDLEKRLMALEKKL